jgi:excisionase family DNA binding protein
LEKALQLEELLTVEEVAAYLRVAPNTVYRWCRSGKLGGTKIGKEWRISQSALSAFLSDRAVELPERPLETLLLQELTPPEHILVMSDDPAEIYELQVKFLKTGYDAGYPLFIGLWWQQREVFREKLMAAGLPFDELVANGRLATADFTTAYTSGGPSAVINIWKEHALAAKDERLWGTGSHALSDWQGNQDALIIFETELHKAFHNLPVVALCPCVLDHVDRAGFEALMRLVPHHSSALFPNAADPVLMKVIE